MLPELVICALRGGVRVELLACGSGLLRFMPTDRDDCGRFPLHQFLDINIEGVEPGHAIARLQVSEDSLNLNGLVTAVFYSQWD